MLDIAQEVVAHNQAIVEKLGIFHKGLRLMGYLHTYQQICDQSQAIPFGLEF